MSLIKLLVASLFVAIASARVINPDLPDFFNGRKPKNQPIEMAQCRATCMDFYAPADRLVNITADMMAFDATETRRMLKNDTVIAQDDACLVTDDCRMCWDFCGMLHTDYVSVMDRMCASRVCLQGCQIACTFYYTTRGVQSPDNSTQVTLTRKTRSIKDEDDHAKFRSNQIQKTTAVFSKNEVLLPEITPCNDTVYFLYGVTSTGEWIEESQTSVPAFKTNNYYEYYMVQVVNSTGVQSSYSFSRRAPHVITNNTVFVGIFIILLAILAFIIYFVFFFSKTKITFGCLSGDGQKFTPEQKSEQYIVHYTHV